MALGLRGRIQPVPTRTATFVIAASDATAKSKAQADYRCDGVADEVQINLAIAALLGVQDVNVPVSSDNATEVLKKNQGGKVYLSEGSFTLAAAIDLSGKNFVTLEGSGPSTIIYQAGTSDENAIECINATDSVASNYITLKEFIIVGNSSSGDGIHIEDIDFFRMSGVTSSENGGNGFFMDRTQDANEGYDNTWVTDCFFHRNDANGITIDNCHDTNFQGCWSEENKGYGLSGDSLQEFYWTGGQIEDNGEFVGGTAGTDQVRLTNLIASNGFSNTRIEGDTSSDSYFYVTGNDGVLMISNTYIEDFYCKAGTGDLNLRISNVQGAYLYYMGNADFQATNCRFSEADIVNGSRVTIEGGNWYWKSNRIIEGGVLVNILGGRHSGDGVVLVNAGYNSAALKVSDIILQCAMTIDEDGRTGVRAQVSNVMTTGDITVRGAAAKTLAMAQITGVQTNGGSITVDQADNLLFTDNMGIGTYTITVYDPNVGDILYDGNLFLGTVTDAAANTATWGTNVGIAN